MSVAFEVRGARDVERRVLGMGPKIQRRVMRTALRGAAGKVKTRIARGTPRRTGLGRRKVKVTAKVNARVSEARIAYSGRRAAVLGMRERGTRRQPARPFFEAAIQGYEAEVMADFAAALRAAVEKNEG